MPITSCSVKIADSAKPVVIELWCMSAAYVCSGLLLRKPSRIPLVPGLRRQGSDADVTWRVDPQAGVFNLEAGALLLPQFKGEDTVEFRVVILQGDTELEEELGTSNPATADGTPSDQTDLVLAATFSLRLSV